MNSAECYHPYFMASGIKDFTNFWKEYLAKPDRNAMFVLGMGFDPRTLDCIRIINKACTDSNVHYRIIHYDDHNTNGKDLVSMADHNMKCFKQLVQKSEQDEVRVRIDPTVDQATTIDAFQNCVHDKDLDEYTDFIVDVSAMPLDVYFPIIKKLLSRTGRTELRTDGVMGSMNRYNVHVVVSENATLDSKIIEAGLAEKASYLHGFSGNLQLESEKYLPKVWFPILGEGKQTQMARICDDVDPSEVAPVFPFPSADPYRTSRMLLEYREFLFDKLGTDPANFVYSHEQNPFELERKICATAMRYSKSLGLLTKCHIVLSPLSSKIRGLGCLLAALDLKSHKQSVGIAYVENHAYQINIDEGSMKKILSEKMPVSASLTGGAYAT